MHFNEVASLRKSNSDLNTIVREAVGTLLPFSNDRTLLSFDFCEDELYILQGSDTLSAAIYRVIIGALLAAELRTSGSASVYISSRRRAEDGHCILEVVTLIPRKMTADSHKVEKALKKLAKDPDLRLAEQTFASVGGSLSTDFHQNDLGVAARFRVELPKAPNRKSYCTLLHLHDRTQCVNA